MQTGTKISTAVHAGLVGWALFGGAFTSEPLPPFEVRDVSVITAQEFERLSATPVAPQVSPEPAALPQPAPEDTPEIAPQVEEQPATVPPQPVAQPEPEPEPEIVSPPIQAPDPIVPDVPATLVAPPIADPAPTQLSQTPRPRSRPARRVAPVPVAQPEREAAPDEVQRPDVSAEAGAEANQPEQQATAPEAASDRVETEANRDETADVGGAPWRSPHPATRPNRRAAAQERAPDRDTTQDAVADALAEALASSLGGARQEAPEPAGPPLTDGEKDALRIAVSKCWNVGALSSEALRTTVVVAVSMGPQGRPSANSIRMVGSSGGSSEAAKKAFEVARRAIIRCGSRGYDLPAEKYSQWRDIEITFNPERMRIK